MVRNDLINLLSSNKPSIYYKVVLKLGSEDVLSICEDREKFIQFLLSFGIKIMTVELIPQIYLSKIE